MSRAALLVAAIAVLASAACDNDDYAYAVVTDVKSAAPVRIDFGAAGIQIPEGAAASAHVDLKAHDDDPLTGDLESLDPSILQIAHTTVDPGTYAFLGVRAGTTQVRIIADGRPGITVPAVVTAP